MEPAPGARDVLPPWAHPRSPGVTQRRTPHRFCGPAIVRTLSSSGEDPGAVGSGGRAAKTAATRSVGSEQRRKRASRLVAWGEVWGSDNHVAPRPTCAIWWLCGGGAPRGTRELGTGGCSSPVSPAAAQSPNPGGAARSQREAQVPCPGIRGSAFVGKDAWLQVS